MINPESLGFLHGNKLTNMAFGRYPPLRSRPPAAIIRRDGHRVFYNALIISILQNVQFPTLLKNRGSGTDENATA